MLKQYTSNHTKFLTNSFKTQEMSVEAEPTEIYLLEYISHKYRTQEMFIEIWILD